MVQVVQVDLVDAQLPQARLAGLPHVCGIGPYVEAARDLISPYQSELAGQQHFITPPPDGPTDQLLILVRVGGVHHRDALVKRGVDYGDRVAVRAVGRFAAQPHRAESLGPKASRSTAGRILVSAGVMT